MENKISPSESIAILSDRMSASSMWCVEAGSCGLKRESQGFSGPGNEQNLVFRIGKQKIFGILTLLVLEQQTPDALAAVHVHAWQSSILCFWSEGLSETNILH